MASAPLAPQSFAARTQELLQRHLQRFDVALEGGVIETDPVVHRIDSMTVGGRRFARCAGCGWVGEATGGEITQCGAEDSLLDWRQRAAWRFERDVTRAIQRGRETAVELFDLLAGR